MAACLRLNAVFQTVFRGCGCQQLCLTSSRPLSFLATKQGKNRQLMDQSQLTCLVCTPHFRQEMTFSKKRRKFVPHHQEDQVSKDMVVIYDNNMNRLNFWGQVTINLLSIPIYGMSINIIAANWPLQDLTITSGPLTAMVYIFAYGALQLGVNNICMRSVKRMYTDADAAKFAAVVQDWKMKKKTVHFDLTSAERKSPHKVLGLFLGNLKILGRSYLVIPSDFTQPRFYNLLMGYDLQRPIEKDMIKDIDIRDAMRGSAMNSKKPPKKGR
ncbi:uncharacterized protein LOC143286178 isoform X2 [Babylonia areolata]|uniref:uncharacterized protein LOC143286178 isoform X2 n=1 Tax=Babylonia areolata TaxID=304850 RepID=UPI003FD4BE99